MVRSATSSPTFVQELVRVKRNARRHRLTVTVNDFTIPPVLPPMQRVQRCIDFHRLIIETRGRLIKIHWFTGAMDSIPRIDLSHRFFLNIYRSLVNYPPKLNLYFE